MQGLIVLLMLYRCGVFPSSTIDYGLLLLSDFLRPGWQPTLAITWLLVFNPGMRSSSDVTNDEG
jgi:hypothetical protein